MKTSLGGRSWRLMAPALVFLEPPPPWLATAVPPSPPAPPSPWTRLPSPPAPGAPLASRGSRCCSSSRCCQQEVRNDVTKLLNV